MINDLPQFDRLPLNPQLEEEKEIFYPHWNCFCCQDSGFIQHHLVRKIIPDYNYNRDKNVACQNPSCKSFHEKWGNIHLENFDTRFLPAICQKLDLFSRENWRNTVKIQIDTRSLSQKMSIRKVNRTENENKEVQERKREIEAIPHEQCMSIRVGEVGE
ncbi:hypothetical protein QHH11_24575 [Aphanizomenon sp. PH219]|nr:hypothetical protein [Aphanizomenon sp. 202]MDK2462259.1 hypothetical protein [Aphanizomenon sp. PH219]MDM3862130.1 hypothetical protein [Aphanizomenon gracile PMC644.10]